MPRPSHRLILAAALAAFAWGTGAADFGTPYNPEAEQPYNPEAESAAPYNPEAEAVAPGEVHTPGAAGSPGTAGQSGAAPAAAEALPPVQCNGRTVCLEPSTGLPLRVLARAFSQAYTGKKVDPGAVARSAIPALTPLYVFAREDMDLSDPANPKGWYQVSDTEAGPPFGWLRAVDAVEWRQALVVAYTHPGSGEEERQRVLMFSDLDALQKLAESEDRETQAAEIYDLIDRGKTPPDIVSKEPEKFVNISKTFYLLPIVDYRTTEINGDELRYLRLAAAVPGARGADTLQSKEYREQAEAKPTLNAAAQKALNVDIVFVMDTTRSMQPYIDNTRAAVKQLAESLIAKEGLQERVRFGLVAYRDDVKLMPALEYTARNFTPQLVPADQFVALVDKEVKATRIGSMDYPEEVYAGVNMAMEQTAWRENSLRFLILVGDASAHEPGHRQSTTGKDANVLRLAMNDKGEYLLAMHLRDYRMSSDHPIAEAQFATLSKIKGSEQSALVPVDIGKTPDYEAFKKAVGEVSATLLGILKAQPGGVATPAAAVAPTAPGKSDVEKQAGQAATALVHAALVEYLGRDANPPKDILVWAADRDLTNPTIRSLEVRVLVTKTQLSSLIQALDRVLQAMHKQQQEQIKLFEALQSVASATMKNPEQIGQAQRLADTGLLPKFIESLPYKSDILSLTEDSFASLTADQRAVLEGSLQAKLWQYRDINEQVDGWVKLNPGDPDSAKVYPLHLSYLP
jgi:serine/threonine-protein kinase PpkA